VWGAFKKYFINRAAKLFGRPHGKVHPTTGHEGPELE
jgi:hypothetical protein